MTDNLAKAKKKRTVVRASVTKILTKIESALQEPDLSVDNDLDELLEHLNEKSNELKSIDLEIESLVDVAQLETELLSAEEYREKITTSRFRATKKIKSMISESKQEVSLADSFASVQVNTNNESKEKVNIRLPKINITKYYGDHSEWLSFWSCFETAIHKNESLDPVDKFNYLKAYLGGSALRSIEGLAMTATHYDSAIKILQERYGNTGDLINTHMSHLIGIPPLKNSNDIKAFRDMYDKIQTQIRSLECLGISTESYGNLLCPILMKIMPRDLLLEFNKEYVDVKYTLKEIMSFLLRQLNCREKTLVDITYKEFPPPPPYHPSDWRKEKKKERTRTPVASDLLAQTDEIEIKCVFCNKHSHKSEACKFARDLPNEEKIALLRKKGVCFRCLTAAKHLSRDCQLKVNCSFCGYRHFSIMCNRQNIPKKEHEKKLPKEKEKESSELSNNTDYSEVQLQTLIVSVVGKNTKANIRLICDSGSTNSYISHYAAKVLKPERVRKEKIKHGLFGGVEVLEDHNRYKLKLISLDKHFTCDIEALDEKKICSSIPKIRNSVWVRELKGKGIHITDVIGKVDSCLFERNPEEIHLLLGADVLGNLLTGRIEHTSENSMVAVETKLGWTLMGKVDSENVNLGKSLSALSLSLHISDAKLTDLWRLDTLGISTQEENKTKSVLEEETRKHFVNTIKRDSTGRYEVSLPWIVDNSILQSNRAIAEKSLIKTENKLISTNKREDYQNIFDFWELEDIIEVVNDNEKVGVHYLPHRPVIKESSETTKIRPVFNASAHTRNNPSLNDCLTKGPNLIEIIPSILNRFRKYRIGVSSDIEKAFLQINIRKEDRDFLRFLWYDDTKNVKVYRHRRVVFGLTSSPYLLAATLEHHLNQAPEHFSETAEVLKTSFYIDNSLTSLNSVEETEKFIKESRLILSSGQFNLRCWQSNVPNSMIEEGGCKTERIPVLGLVWNLEDDSLTCKIEKPCNLDEPVTKRKVLSWAQKVFDPIGFTSPITLVPKLILQETWIQKIKWDEVLPAPLQKQFSSWVNQLYLLSEVKIPRWLNIDYENEEKVSFHVFSDASKRAYAACVYIRTETVSGAKVQLVNARSRVAPIKEMTIPRLELLSCLIGARLAKTAKSDLRMINNPTTYWTDSSTALGWIKRDQTWGTFVHNRVQEIRALTDTSDWKHVPGNLNIADLPSRGCYFEQLQKSKWWEGPPWLYLPKVEWPQSEEQPDEELLDKERRKTIVTLIDKEMNSDWYYRYFSSFKRIVRMIAWILRFYRNARKLENELSPNLSVLEIEKAEKTLYRLIQKDSFTGITDPNLRTLRPIETEEGILRAKTNIIQRNDKLDFRYPVILPSNHAVVQRLIYEKHVELQHAGVTILMANLREKFWILKTRKTIRNVIRKCIKCKRFDQPKLEAEPGIPPEDRVREAAVFEVVGVDLAGPLYLSDGSKSWIVLYTCAIYRAIHLELVTSLSTESFIQSLRRFISRRGRPYIIYSDNGSNFKLTHRALSNIDWTKVASMASSQKIRWKFNPPSAAWWGGWWERLVRMVKQLLRRILGRACLKYEELNTILCDCEQIVNSRPITYVSEDVKDPEPLTPLMFLHELPSSGVPDIDAIEIDCKELGRRAKYRQRLRNDLRNRFRNEYLGQLRQQAVKKQKFEQLKIGDIVLVEDHNRRRLQWPLARIIDIFPGKDNVVRLAKIKTENGVFLRPIQRLYPLEILPPKTVPMTTETIDLPDARTIQEPNPSSRAAIQKPDLRVGNRTTDQISSTPVVTRAGRVVRPPRRLQRDLLSSSITSDLKVGVCYGNNLLTDK